MKSTKIKVNDSFLVNALRNCGYNNYSAIADIIDNAIEPEVESTFVRVNFETEGTGVDKTTIKSLLIIDDGVGMVSETLEEAMSLGSNTGKNCVDNLGCYGTGLKAASISIGRILEVFTKTENSPLNYARFSIDETIENGGDISVEFKTIGENEEGYDFFIRNVSGTHGTIVKISKLDRLSNTNYHSFKNTLKRKIGEIFNKFIYSDVVKFYVGNGDKSKVAYVDLMMDDIPNIVMGEGDFNVDGHQIKYKAYYLPLNGGETEENEEQHRMLENGIETLPRSERNSGLYIYRNNRLVGRGLILGMWGTDPWRNGFRCEIFIDGSCDYLFGSTFTKVINEKTKESISKSLLDMLEKYVKPYALESSRRQHQEKNEHNVVDPEAIKANNEFYKKVVEKQNKNMMLKGNRKGENHKQDEEVEKEHKTRGKQMNPNPIKERTNKWLGGFEEQGLGRNAERFSIVHSNNKPLIIINTDHSFYKNFYSQLDNDLKFIMAQIISCEELAKQNSNYYNNEEVRKVIDCFNSVKDMEIFKSLTF